MHKKILLDDRNAVIPHQHAIQFRGWRGYHHSCSLRGGSLRSGKSIVLLSSMAHCGDDSKSSFTFRVCFETLIKGNPGHFVSCSGATRRRMNVTSTIKRPGSQRCSIVDVDWAELFPDPHPNDS